MLFRTASKRVLWAASLDNTPLLLPPEWRGGVREREWLGKCLQKKKKNYSVC